MREPRPDCSPLGVNFKILDEHPHLFIFEFLPPPGRDKTTYVTCFLKRQSIIGPHRPFIPRSCSKEKISECPLFILLTL